MPTTLTDSTVHYVKFRRGSVEVWNSLLSNPNQIDDDTLYFIYDTSVANPLEGKLYLGQKLISGSGSSSGTMLLNDLVNVVIDGETLDNKQILVYNAELEKWQNASLSDIISTAVGTMEGATLYQPGVSGLVPRPSPGDNLRFLRGDATWADITIPTFNTDIFNLNNNEVSLLGYNLAPIGSTLVKTANGIQWTTVSSGTINRQITTLEKLRAQIAGTDPEPLSENMIYLVNNGSDGSSGNQYDEYIIVNGSLEKMGVFGQYDLSNYVTIPTFNTEITRLDNILLDQVNPETHALIPGLVSRVRTIELNYITQAEIGDLNNLVLSQGNSTLVDQVNTVTDIAIDMQERLRWQELSNE